MAGKEISSRKLASTSIRQSKVNVAGILEALRESGKCAVPTATTTGATPKQNVHLFLTEHS